jgi:hypothetical protein
MSINNVTLSGRVCRLPKRVRAPENGGHVFVFPLAVRERDRLVFPVVVTGQLPPFVVHKDGLELDVQPLVTVVGRVRTRNLTRPLRDDVLSQVKQAQGAREAIAALWRQIEDRRLLSRRVVTEIVADFIFEGGCW